MKPLCYLDEEKARFLTELDGRAGGVATTLTGHRAFKSDVPLYVVPPPAPYAPGPIVAYMIDAGVQQRLAFAPLPGSFENIELTYRTETMKYRHKVTKGEYSMVGTAKLQTGPPLTDMAEVVVYRGEDGRLWVRRAEEFDDRFERVKP
jgi:hypothetical protein